MTKAAKQKSTKPPSSLVLFPIMRYANPGQLTVPDRLNLGNDGKLYLTRAGEAGDPKPKPPSISLKESFAWFRLGQTYNLNLTREERFDEWLKLIERALP